MSELGDAIRAYVDQSRKINMMEDYNHCHPYYPCCLEEQLQIEEEKLKDLYNELNRLWPTDLNDRLSDWIMYLN